MSQDYEVVIVGAGPTGDVLAALLGQRGIRTLLADKSPDIYPLPRAAHIDHEIVRVFQEIGIADEVMATSRPSEQYDFLTADRQVLLRFLSKGSPSGWPPANMIHQPSIEAALRKVISNLEPVDLRLSWNLLACDVAGSGARLRFSTPDGETEVTARYVVGADGASSQVRALLGVKVEDLQFDEPWLVIDTLVHDPSRLPTMNLQICDPERPTTCVLMGEGRHRWEFMIKPGETPDQVMKDDFIAEQLKPWNVEGAVTLERKAVYRFHALIAETWRVGPVFLAGDAAHQMPPFAGQGLCSGVRDAANLAWKLAAVLRGGAPDALLNSYEVERRPHVRSIIDLALMMGKTVCILDPEAATQRNAAMLAQRAAAAPETPGQGMGFPPLTGQAVLDGSVLAGGLFIQPWAGTEKWDDHAGPGAWLITREDVADLPGLAVFKVDDPKISDFASSFETWLTKHGVNSVLVRPDRYVFGTGSAQELIKAWSSVVKAA